jgi:hypothetical protein
MLGVSWSGNSGFCSVCIFDKPRTVWQEEFEDIGVLSTSICQCCYPLKMCEIQYNEADSQGKRPDIFRSRTSSLKRSIVDRSPSQTHKPYVVISVRTFERFRFGHPFAYRFSPTSLTFDFFQLIFATAEIFLASCLHFERVSPFIAVLPFSFRFLWLPL